MSYDTIVNANFAQFGRHGPEIDFLRRTTWERAAVKGTILAKQYGYSSFEAAVEDALDCSGLWMGRMLALVHRFQVIKWEKMIEFWDGEFRQMFHPWLRSAADVAKTDLRQLRDGLLECWVKAQSSKDLERRWTRLHGVCFSPYSDVQMDYIARVHRRTVEIGCGSGYLLAELIARGVDAFGIDKKGKGAYKLETNPNFDWVPSLVAEPDPRLIVVEETVDELRKFADRTVIISSPNSDSGFLLEAVQAITELGGQSILFKHGGFGVSFSRPTHDEAKLRYWGRYMLACYQFFCQHWEEDRDDPHRPPFVPGLYQHNLFALRPRQR